MTAAAAETVTGSGDVVIAVAAKTAMTATPETATGSEDEMIAAAAATAAAAGGQRRTGTLAAATLQRKTAAVRRSPARCCRRRLPR